MKLQQSYLSGFERKSFVAYGYNLHPLTLGHVQLLAEMESAIPFPGKKVEHADVGMVVAVAAFSMWEDARVHLLDTDAVSGLIKKIVTEPAEDEIDAVLSYLVYYLAKPRHNGNMDFMDSRCPWWWTYAEFMQTEMHRTEKQAWGTICSDAFAYYASFATRNGSDQFLTFREAYFADQIAAGKTMEQLFAEGMI